MQFRDIFFYYVECGIWIGILGCWSNFMIVTEVVSQPVLINCNGNSHLKQLPNVWIMSTFFLHFCSSFIFFFIVLASSPQACELRFLTTFGTCTAKKRIDHLKKEHSFTHSHENAFRFCVLRHIFSEFIINRGIYSCK